VGFRKVQNIALGTGVFNSISQLPTPIFDRKNFWKHCIGTAFLSMELATVTRPRVEGQADVMHLGGLIHDLGKILLEIHFPELLEQCIRAALKTRQPLYLVEQKLLGMNHTEIGALLVEKWNLPEAAVSVVHWHHDPQKAPENHRTVVELVHLANYIANTQDLGSSGDMGGPVFQRKVWDSLGISAAMIPVLVRKVVEIETDLVEIIH